MCTECVFSAPRHSLLLTMGLYTSTEKVLVLGGGAGKKKGRNEPTSPCLRTDPTRMDTIESVSIPCACTRTSMGAEASVFRKAQPAGLLAAAGQTRGSFQPQP
mmetsp:Transcript_76322/g.139001  ORF Transcript_76322/g.139001 Transcript_76322/m.139001 type:complete len:103 (+) Transcript_76322:336-644(+)